MNDPYSTLGVTKDASDAEIKTKYRKLAKQYHPDMNPDNEQAEKKFKEISEAYEQINTFDKRVARDMEFDGFGDSFQGFGFSTGPVGDIGDLINNIFNGGFRHDKINRDVSISYQATLEEIFHGKHCSVTYRVNGEIKNVSFNLPKGIPNGAALKFEHRGTYINSSIPPGDLHVKILRMPHFKFEAMSNGNLATTISVDIFTAILGGEVFLDHIDGSKIKIIVPASSQPGTILQLSGKGMPIYNSNEYGDLLVKLNFNIPPLTNHHIEKLKELKEDIDNHTKK